MHAAGVWGKKQRAAYAALRGPVEERIGHALPDTPPLGCVLGFCRLSACKPMTDDRNPLFPENAEPVDELDRMLGDWSPGRYAFRLNYAEMLPTPIQWTGSQGRPRRVPPMLAAEVRAQLGLVTA